MTPAKRNLIIKVLGSVVILLALFYWIDFDLKVFKQIIQQLNLVYFLLSLSGVLIVLAIKSYRWHLIIKQEGFFYSPYKSFGAYMASFAIGVVTPGRIGEIARLYYLRQDCEIEFIPSFRTIVTDRIFDLGVLVMLGIAALIYFGGWLGSAIYLAIFIGVLIFIIGLIGTKFTLNFMMRSKSFGKWGIIRFLHTCVNVTVTKNGIALWFITLLAYLAYYGAIWILFMSLAIDLPIVDIAVILSVTGLSTLLPISYAGFGTREVTLVYLLSYYGIASETALTFSLLQFSAFFVWGGFIGLVFWFLMPVSMKQVKEDSKALGALIRGVSKESQ